MAKFETFEELVEDYFFSSLVIEGYTKTQQMTLKLAKKIITMHGAGGKFVEDVIIGKYGLSNTDGIHGWDASKKSRPVEIKTETINKTKPLRCEGSYTETREKTKCKSELYAEEKPILYSVGICNKTGKCIYVMETDTAKIDKKLVFWKRLMAKSPRIRFSHWMDSKNSWKVIYKNEELIRARANDISDDLLDALGYHRVARLPI